MVISLLASFESTGPLSVVLLVLMFVFLQWHMTIVRSSVYSPPVPLVSV